MGRGELQLGILVENMRREGFELGVCLPQVGRTRITLECPTRGLLGYRSIFFTDTRGSGILTRAFKAYEPYKGGLQNVRKGVLVSMRSGVSTSYSLGNLQPRSERFIDPAVEVYVGMIIGEHSRENDLESKQASEKGWCLIVGMCGGGLTNIRSAGVCGLQINCVEAKQQANIRSAGADEKIFLTPPRQFSLKEMIPYMMPDEMVEVTPSALRLCKQILDPNLRRRGTKTLAGDKVLV